MNSGISPSFDSQVKEVAHLPIGEPIIGTADGDVTVCDREDWSSIATYSGHDTEISALTGWPEDEVIVSGSVGGRICVWSLDSSSPLAILEDHENIVTTLKPEPRGEWLFSGAYDETIRVWNPDNGWTCDRRWSACRILDLAVRPTGEKVVSGGIGSSPTLWTVADGSAVEFGGHDVATVGVEFVSDSQFFSLGYDGDLYLWDVDSRDRTVTIDLNESDEFVLGISPARDFLGIGSARELRIFDIEEGKNTYSWDIPSLGVQSLSIAPDGESIVIASLDGRVEDFTLFAHSD